MAAAGGVGLHLIGAATATLIVAVLVAAVLGRRRRARAQPPPVEGKPAPEAGCAVGDGAGPDGGTDVIIVGAGVAGSALAYTLGKVVSLVSSFLAWFH
jgi:squalene monooxygenase